MDIFTHFLLGIIISIFTLNSFGFEIVLFGGIMAVIADFDIFLEPFKKFRTSNLLSHKGISHSFFSGLLISLPFALIFTFITNHSFLIVWMIGFVFYGLHVILDFMGASKIPLLFPFIKKRFRFFIDRAINIYLALISGCFILFYLIIFFVWPELYFSNLIFYIFGFYIVYLSYRIFTKVWIQLNLPENSHYIPGLLPFTYLIYQNQNSENFIIYKLIKKVQFISKETKLLDSKIKNDTLEMKYFEQVLILSKKYIFFSKWKFIFPILQKNEKIIVIILSLAESYASGRMYSLKVTFDLATNKILNEIEGFNKKIQTMSS
ncbi:MAG: metal-dependent hydrolase, partial [Candidatus Hodarchaeota archaeon]